MIPKIIHYCWLSDDPIPPNLQRCINSWKQYCPEYKIIKWDRVRFDINSIELVKEAYYTKNTPTQQTISELMHYIQWEEYI